MTQQSVHGSEVIVHQPDRRRRYAWVAVLLVVVSVAITLFAAPSQIGRRSSSSSREVASYSEALAMQYARPWLEKEAAAAAPAQPFGELLAMQYARPWLDAMAANKPACSGRLDLIYACQYGGWRPAAER